MNILFVTLDQFRADTLGVAGHSLVATPTLDRIATEGVRLAQHYSQAAPCSPGRAALYTGTYQMNNRVVANGTPHAAHLDNIALVLRRAGYDPTLFGYTDQGLDPAQACGDDDPRLDYYDGILRGFSVGCYLPENQAPWTQWLRQLGYDVPQGWVSSLSGEPARPAEHSLSSFLTDRYLSWLGRQESGWCAHLSYLRPHPPYAAAGHFSTMYSPDDVTMPLSVAEGPLHPLHQLSLQFDGSASPTDPAEIRELRAQYYGMVSEVDAQLGRVVEALEARHEWNDTLVIITSDHGEQLGDHGLKEKLAYFPQSYHVLGLWRDPRSPHAGTVIEEFTENVDILPTLCGALGVSTPAQVDGRSLAALFESSGAVPATKDAWRTTAHYEWDWRYFFINQTRPPWPVDRTLSRQNLAVGVSRDISYVQFGDGSFRCFDLAIDPTWRTECHDESRVLTAAQELLVWRQEHLSRELTDLLLTPQRPGRWPAAATR